MTYESAKPDAIERLARIEGESNFMSLLAGVEAGKDTTEDMGALGFARARGAVPELLEAHVAQSTMYRLPLMTLAYRAIVTTLLDECRSEAARERCRAKLEKDRAWMQGAVADAFLLIRTGACKPADERAKSFRVDGHAYKAMRNLAHGVLQTILNAAIKEFKAARRSTREIPGFRHSEYTQRENFLTPGQASPLGHFRAPKLLPAGPDAMNGYEARAVGITDRLGWDARRELKPGRVTTYTPEQYAALRQAEQSGTAYGPPASCGGTRSRHNRPDSIAAGRCCGRTVRRLPVDPAAPVPSTARHRIPEGGPRGGLFCTRLPTRQTSVRAPSA